MITLTDRQAEFLGLIDTYFAKYQRMPTHRELAAAVGVSSTNGVNQMLHRLRSHRYLGADGTPTDAYYAWLRASGATDEVTLLRLENRKLRKAIQANAKRLPDPIRPSDA